MTPQSNRFTLQAAAVAGGWLLLSALAAPAQTIDAKPGPGKFFVAPNGKDEWSGQLPAPEVNSTNGPFATLERAQRAHREGKVRSTIFVRAGTYYLEAPLTLTERDSGCAYLAYPNERPVLSGGRPITGWRKGPSEIWAAPVPEARGGRWAIRQLRVGNEMQTCARAPNFDPANPTQAGWLFVVHEGPKAGRFGAALSRIHMANDWLEWTFKAPKDGEYRLWFLYSAANRQFGFSDLAGRVVAQVDGGPPVDLQNLPDSPGLRWSQTASFTLNQGDHILRWTNVKGGFINLDALALCDDPGWNPAAGRPPATGRTAIPIQAESFSASECKEMVVPETGAPAYRDRFQFRFGDLKPYRSPEPEIHFFAASGSVNTILQATRIDVNSRTAFVENNSNAVLDLRVGNRYFVSNVMEELDRPGEWYFDRVKGSLYYWPKLPSFERLGVVASALDRLIEFRGDPAKNQWVEEVTIKGFQFSDTTYSRNLNVHVPNDAAIWVSGARRCVIEGNLFTNLGGYAARLENRSTGVEFVGNEVAAVGQGGVLLTGSNVTQPKDNLIAGNWMHHLGRVFKHVAGVQAATASGTRVAHNRFEQLPRYAISFKSFDANNYSHNNVAEYNDVRFTNLETSETGAIETLGRHKTETGNVIQYNRILDVVGLATTPEGKIVSPHATWGIYLDEYSSGTTVRGNVVVRDDWGGGCIHGGRNNVFENNVFVDGAAHQMGFLLRDQYCEKNRFVRNIIAFGSAKTDLFSQSGIWRPQVLAECNYNLYWHKQGPAFFIEKSLTPLGTFAKWQAGGFDTNSQIADPLFMDASKEDYRLKPMSPALKLGFQQIPFEKIGLEGYPRSWRK